MSQVGLVVVGAGLRAQVYARRAVQRGARIVAVAEPNQERRERFAAEFSVGAVFSDWREIDRKLADAAIIATPDRVHAEPAVALADLGYHLMLEKPMAPTEPEARRIAETVERNGVIFALC